MLSWPVLGYYVRQYLLKHKSKTNNLTQNLKIFQSIGEKELLRSSNLLNEGALYVYNSHHFSASVMHWMGRHVLINKRWS